MYNKKVLSTAKKELTKAKAPKKPDDMIVDPMGQWKYPGLPTRIPGNDITMEGVGYPVLGVANNGQKQMMQPGEEYTFPGADYVDEYPQMRKGGTRKRRKTKSLSGTNELMLPNPLLRNYKNRVYDPNVDYFQEGGPQNTSGPREYIPSQYDYDFDPTDEDKAQIMARIVQEAGKGNKAARRMMDENTKDYTFTGDEFDEQMQRFVGVPAGEKGSHFSASMENSFVPFIQEGENGELYYNGKANPNDAEAIHFNTPEEAEFFANHYKKANPPMMRDWVKKHFDEQEEKQKGGYKTELSEEEEKEFQKFYESLPENLRADDPTYDIRGYWDGSGRPSEFDYSQPKEDDGYYHAFSINPNTGEYLKSPIHPTFQHAIEEDKKMGYRPTFNIRTGRWESEEVSPEYANGGDVNLELTQDEIDQYVKGGYIVEDISVPELNQARKGKIVNTSKSPKPSVYTAKNDKDYAFRKKAYDDSLAIYNLDKDYSNLSLKAAKLLNDPNSDESKYFDIQDKLKKNYSEQYKILKNSNVPHKLIPVKERIKGDRAMMHPKPTQTIVKPYKQEADKTKEKPKFITNKSKEKILEISDPKEFAYRNQKYKDSLDLHDYSNKQIADKTKRFGSDAIGVKKEYNKRKATEFLKEQLKTYGDLAHDPKDKYGKLITKLVKKSNISPIGLSINVEDYDYIFKKPTQKVVLKTENKPVQDTIIQKPVVQQEVKPIIQQNIKPVQKTNYPEGYQPYSLYGRVLDPEIYGYGESIHDKPIQLAQGADMMLKKMQMEKYKKSGKYPWSKQNGGLIEAQTGGIKTHKSKDGTVTNTITKANGDTIIQVKTKNGKYYEKLIKKSDALDTLSKLQGAVSPEFQALSTAKTNTEKQEKEAKQKFLKEAWSDYNKWSTVDKASDRVGAFLNDPFGMISRTLLGEQAYIPGMAQGLHNHEDPEVRNRYLKELGYTPGEFDASDVQNIINPGYWASSFAENSRKGDIGAAALDAGLMFLPHLPKGTISRSNIKSGAKLLADDIVNKTPLKNTYKILGKDTKFHNPGEKPHWFKGYTESWNPMEADLEPLANFRVNQAVKNLQNRAKFKEHDAVNDKFSQILNDLINEKEIALKANDKKAVSEINAKLDDVFNARLKEHNKIAQKHFQSKQHPFEEQIGAGGFGTVYGLPESEYVIKVGQIPKNENIFKLVENAKGINKPNIALPKRASTTSSGENVIVMNKVEPVQGNMFTTPPTKESYEQLIKDVEELQGKGIYLDFENPQNIQYNPKTGLFNIYDLNTTGHVLHKTLPKNSYKASEKTIEQLLIDNKKLPLDWNKKVSKQLSTLPNLNKEEIVKAGLDGNFLTRPLTLFTKNEMLGTPDKKMLYRKIGNAKGLQDLIEKQGAQAPAPMRMTSGATIDTPFFGAGTKPNENYRGMFAVEVDPSNPKYRWSNNVGGVSNYGVAPYNPETGELVKNIPLEDLNVYKKKWFSNNYKKLKPEELKAALTFAREQALIENLYKWGVRGVAADQIFNDGEYSKAIQNYFLGKPNISRKKRIDAEDDYEKGGFVADLTPEEIQDYIAQGYTIEDVY